MTFSAVPWRGQAAPAESHDLYPAATWPRAAIVVGSALAVALVLAQSFPPAMHPWAVETPLVEPAQLWAAAERARSENLSAALPEEIPAPSYPGDISASLSPFELAAGDAGLRAEAGESLIPDVGDLYAGVEGPDDAVTADGNDVRVMVVQPGDTLGSMLAEASIGGNETTAAITALAGVFDPKLLRAGQRVTIASRAGEPADGVETRALVSILIKPSIEREIRVTRGAEGFAASETIHALAARDYHATGTINSSLYLSATQAGVPDSVVIEMIRLFSYDVDFQREIQPGDRFEIFFSRFYDEFGAPVREGEIQYAALVLSGKPLELYRYTTSENETDYFDPKGRSVRKFLMRTPVDGARISSTFGMRHHPVLGYTRMHKGVDFAVPTGTPIMAAGDGVIEFRGKNGGYGNYIRIRHNSEYKTAYAHMSRFAAAFHVGSRVRQGEIIGYVGKTGTATGPHLHYEILVDNKQINPLSVKVPTGKSLEGAELARFLEEKARIDAAMKAAPANVPVAAAAAGAASATPQLRTTAE